MSTVTVWLVEADSPDLCGASPGEVARRLGPAERARADRLSPDRRWRFVAFRAALRSILRKHGAELEDGADFERTKNGKPVLAGGPEFSFSASEGLALIAISDRGPVGVDIERIRDVHRPADWRTRHPALGAMAFGEELGDRSDAFRFLRAWTRLEAFYKREGLPLAGALEGSIGGRDGALARHLSDPGSVVDLDPPPGYLAACALSRGATCDRRITMRTTCDTADPPVIVR